LAERKRNDDVRREMLAAIREHLAASTPFDAVREEKRAHHDGAAQPARAAAVAQGEALAPVERFKQSLEAVGGHCTVVRDEAEAAEALARIVVEAKAQRVAASDSALVRRVLARMNSGAQVSENVSAAELFDYDLGVTGAQWGVAETGTLVLESDEERHRLASLVPPAHVALVAAASVRQTLAEVLETVGARGRDGMSRTITFITGPSRTSDIELTLAIGVHGPGELHVVIVEELSDGGTVGGVSNG
jgi:L-lactate dehydrogenase complex protein LldG